MRRWRFSGIVLGVALCSCGGDVRLSGDFLVCQGCRNEDCDNDQIKNPEELRLGTDPCHPDTDRDGLRDGVEVAAIKICAGEGSSVSPVVCQADQDCGAGGPCVGLDPLDDDQDGDGITDGAEDRNGDGFVGDCNISCGPQSICGSGATCVNGFCRGEAGNCRGVETDPRLPDTDGDGLSDAEETVTKVCGLPPGHPYLVREQQGDWQFFVPSGFEVVERRSRPASKRTHPDPDPESNDWRAEVRDGFLSGMVLSDPSTGVAGFVLALENPESSQSDPLQTESHFEKVISDLEESEFFTTGSYTPSGIADQKTGATVRTTLFTINARASDAQDLATWIFQAASDASNSVPELRSGDDPVFYVLLLTTVVRHDNPVYLGAIFPSTDGGKSETLVRSSGLVDPGALGRLDQVVRTTCQAVPVTSRPMVDVVWIVEDPATRSDFLGKKVPGIASVVSGLSGESFLDVRTGVVHLGQDPEAPVVFWSQQLTGDFHQVSRWLSESQTTPAHHAKAVSQGLPVLAAGKKAYETYSANGLRDGAQLVFVMVTEKDDSSFSDELSPDQIKTKYEEMAEFYRDNHIHTFVLGPGEPSTLWTTLWSEPQSNLAGFARKVESHFSPLEDLGNPTFLQALWGALLHLQGVTSPYKITGKKPVSSSIALGVGGDTGREGGLLDPGTDNGFLVLPFNVQSIVFTMPFDPGGVIQIGDTVFLHYSFFDRPLE